MCRWKERKRKTEKEVIVNDMKMVGVSVEDAGDRVEWKSRTRVADPK